MTEPDRESFKLPLRRPPEVLNDSMNFEYVCSYLDLKKSSLADFLLTSDITTPEYMQECEKLFCP